MKHFCLIFNLFYKDGGAINSPKNYLLNWLSWVCAFVSFLLAKPLNAATLPNGFSETRLASGLDPTGMEFSPDGRLFITEKPGRIRIIKNGVLLSTPFLTLSVNNNNERGLQNIVFDPDFANNKYIYVYYTVSTSPIHNRVSRFVANGDVAVAGSETVIFELDNLVNSYHNGGGMFFSGGKLFITSGEDGNYIYAQSMNNLLGKVLRINPDGSIPTDNPFYDTNTGKNRAIWALGLRHPFRATIQPGTGRIFIGDVGSSNFEEINEGLAGKNYGWPGIEGFRTNQTQPANYQDPVYAYDHYSGCAITGGAFCNPSTSQFPSSFDNKYFFADYCYGYIKTLDLSNGGAIANFGTNINRPISIKFAPDGSLYYIARGGLGGGSDEDNTTSSDGEVWRVQYVGNNVPTISAQPNNQVSTVGGGATFTIGASGTGISYQWQQNGVNINGATSSSYTRSPVVQSDNGTVFRVVVTNSSGSIISNEATLTVTTNQNPITQIITPTAGSIYRAGNTISFSGSATDPEDGDLPASAFQWRIDFHHDTHVHPGPTPNVSDDGRSGTFAIPTTGETASNVWYRVFLTVTDSQGGSATKFVDVSPRVVNIMLKTNPAGLQFNIDGQPHTAPYSQPYVTGLSINLMTPTTQTINGITYTFASWTPSISLDGQISVPEDNITYTATFSPPPTGLRDPENPSNALSGLNYQYYEGGWSNLPDFSTLIPNKTGTANTIDIAPRSRDENYALRFEGYVNAPTDGQYTFYTTSDDGSKLYIGSTQVVDNDGSHGDQERSGTIGLKAGKHAISVTVFQGNGGQSLSASYTGPGIDKQIIPSSALFHLTPPPSPLPPSADGGSGTGLLAEYFDNRTMSAPVVVSRVDATVDVDWGNGSPASAISVDNFSARWTGQVEAPVSGNYTFSLVSDDGVRLWVNNVLMINNWTNHGPTTDTSPAIALMANQKYDIKLEYYENNSGALVHLLWSLPGLGPQIIPKGRLYPATSPPPPTGLRDPENPSNALSGLNYQYYEGGWSNLPDFSTLIPNKTGTANTIDIAPRSRDENYALRFEGYVNAPTDGQYTFYTTSDDGSKLYIGSTQVVDNDGSHGDQERSGTIGLKAGKHAISVTVFQGNGGQSLSASYTGPGIDKQIIPSSALFHLTPPPSPLPPSADGGSGTGLLAEYFDNRTMSAPVVVSRVDATVDVDWGNGSPASAISVDNFSARWTGQVEAPVSGNYTFSLVSDDGVRLWVNNVLMINNWTNHGPTTDTSPAIALMANQKYDIKLEYYENNSGALVHLLWSLPGLGPQIIPKGRLYPATSPPPPTGLRDPENPSNALSGLNYQYYEGGWSNLPDFSTLIPNKTGTANTIDIAPRSRDENYALRFEGYVNAPTDGQYTFYTTSDDGSKLYIGSTQVVDNDGSHGDQERSGTIGLKAGKHAISVTVFQGNGGQSLSASYTGPGIDKQIIPSSALFHLTPPPSPLPPSADGGSGTGLLAEYFDNRTMSAPVVVSRVDATVDVDWGNGSPASAISVDNFSARWTGQVEAPVSGNYTFSLVSDDGVRLWVNNVLMINNWTNHGPTTDTSPAIALMANQKYDIKLEYYENNSGALVHLLWSLPGLGPQIIPKGRLYPATSPRARLGSSQVKSYDSESPVQVYPLPAIDELRIDYVSTAAGELSLRLVNQVGQSVLQLHDKVIEGQNLIRISVRALNRGLYILYMDQGNRQIRRKVLLSE